MLSVTVCQLHEAPDGLEDDWPSLARHVARHGSDLVVLPEMPFAPWLAGDREVDRERWDAAVAEHDRWLARLGELGPVAVVGSRPVTVDGVPLNEGFAWDAAGGYRAVHHKVYLPQEPGFWEASWYESGPAAFDGATIAGLEVGFLICSEIWFTEHARDFGRRGAHLVVVPRATPAGTADKWLAGGRVTAVVSGAWCLSSNRGGIDERGAVWDGAGWIVEPESGDVVAVTSENEPFVSRRIDPQRAVAAKRTYPRYIENPQGWTSV